MLSQSPIKRLTTYGIKAHQPFCNLSNVDPDDHEFIYELPADRSYRPLQMEPKRNWVDEDARRRSHFGDHMD